MWKSLLPPFRCAEAKGFSAREADKGNEPGTRACGHFAAALVPFLFPLVCGLARSTTPASEVPSGDLPLPGILPCVTHYFTYISLGAGVQSTTLVILSVLGLHGCPRAPMCGPGGLSADFSLGAGFW